MLLRSTIITMTMTMTMTTITTSARRRRCRTNTNTNTNTNNNRRRRRVSTTMILPTTTTIAALISFLIVASSSSTVEGYCPVVICPGFCNDSHDYEYEYEYDNHINRRSESLDNSESSDSDNSSLKSVLSKRGFCKSQIYTIPVQRHDWIRSIAGGLLFDYRNFQQGTTNPITGVAYGWYIRRLKEIVDIAYKESGGQKVLLIGHSAGGWLARAAMGDGIWSESEKESSEGSSDEDSDSLENNKVTIVRTSDRIRCLATIGSIHQEPEQDKQTCVTRGALKYTNDNYPGAYLKNEGIGYVSIGGTTTTTTTTTSSSIGTSSEEKDDEEEKEILSMEAKANRRVAYTSYKAVSGNEKYVIGDGVVPIEWTQLMGSKQIELQNVLHSIHNYRATASTSTSTLTSTSTSTTGGTSTTQQQQQQQHHWYGSESVIDSWLSFVLEEANLLQVVKTKRVVREEVATARTAFDILLVKTKRGGVVLGEHVQVEQVVNTTTATTTTSFFDNNNNNNININKQQQQQRRRKARTTPTRPLIPSIINLRRVRSFNILLRRRMLQVFLLFLKTMNIHQRSSSNSMNNSNKK